MVAALRRELVLPETATDNWVRKVYEQVFPAHERPDYSYLQSGIVEQRASLFCYFVASEPVGFAYVVRDSDLIYLFFLAVSPDHQSRGYGTAILTDLKQFYAQRPILITIEPLSQTAKNAQQRQKRLSFYQQNGFETTDYLYHEAGESYALLTSHILPETSYQKLPQIMATFFHQTLPVSLTKL